MMTGCPEIKCDLLVIGTGMAGMAAALFAARRGIDTVQVGMTGEINFASGLLDLLGVHPVATGQSWYDPWDGIAQLIKDQPHHPYARIGWTPSGPAWRNWSVLEQYGRLAISLPSRTKCTGDYTRGDA